MGLELGPLKVNFWLALLVLEVILLLALIFKGVEANSILIALGLMAVFDLVAAAGYGTWK